MYCSWLYMYQYFNYFIMQDNCFFFFSLSSPQPLPLSPFIPPSSSLSLPLPLPSSPSLFLPCSGPRSNPLSSSLFLSLLSLSLPLPSISGTGQYLLTGTEDGSVELHRLSDPYSLASLKEEGHGVWQGWGEVHTKVVKYKYKYMNFFSSTSTSTCMIAV